MENQSPEPNTKEALQKGWKAWDKWVRQNWFTVIGIIIILLVVGYNYGTIEKQKVDVANKCNEFWIDQVKTSCPALFAEEPKFIVPNISGMGVYD